MTTLLHRPPAQHPQVATRSAGVLGPTTLVLAVAMSVLVARDGTPGWVVVRLALVWLVAAAVLGLLATRARAWTACLVGYVGTVAGAALGPWSVVKHGSWVAGTAGCTALLAGAVLLVGGAGLVVRGVRSWRRWLLAPVLLVVALLPAAPVFAAVAVTNVPRPAMTAATPPGYTDVTFPAGDGVRLSGWYAPGRNGAAVVVLHGASSTRASVRGQAAVLARHGYGVLVYDARGHGRSGGRAMDWGWYGDQDVAGAAAFLQRAGVDRIGALGESMGGEQAVGALPAVPGLRAVVGEGTTFRSSRDFGWLSREFGARGWLQRGVEAVATGLADTLTAASPPRSLRAAVGSGTPVLLVAAGTVENEPIAARWTQGGAPSSVQVWVVPGSGHTGGLTTAPAEWEARVVGFFDRTLA